MSFSWGIVSGCFIGPYIWGIYWKKTTKAGAFAGMIAGFLTVVVSTVVLTVMNLGGGTAYEAFKACFGESSRNGRLRNGCINDNCACCQSFYQKFDSEHLNKVFKGDKVNANN